VPEPHVTTAGRLSPCAARACWRSPACLPAAAGTASAQTSCARSVTNAVTTVTGARLAHATLTTSYTASQVTVTVSPGTLRLQPGRQYRAMVCLNTHILGAAPTGRCVTDEIDARAAVQSRVLALPPVSDTIDRPAAGSSGYATQQVTPAARAGVPGAP
jgi:hypothetical protein